MPRAHSDHGGSFGGEVLDGMGGLRVRMKEPVHPGSVVRRAIEDLDVSVTVAAQALHVSQLTLSNLINGNAGISPEMAVRLAKAIGSTPGFWMRLQMNYDVAQVERRADLIEVSPLCSEGAGDPSHGNYRAAQELEGKAVKPRRARKPGAWREGNDSFRKTVKH